MRYSRYASPLNFATIGYLEDELLSRLKGRSELNHVLIAAHGINAIDAPAAEKLGILVEHLRRENFEVSFSGFKDNVLDVVRQTQACREIREERIFPTQAVAVEAIHPKSHQGSTEKRCPLLEVVHTDPPGHTA